MANATRVRANFVAGALDAALTSSATSMSSPALADLPAIGATEHAVISLYTADSNGRITAKEIVYVTAHTTAATTAAIERGKEGTTGVAWASGDKWEHGATTADFAATWTQVLDEPGTSLANWTVVSGTWAANAGGYLELTDTSAAYRALRLTAEVHAGAGIVAEAEIRFPTSATTGRRGMIGPSGDGLASATSSPWGGLGENSGLVYVQQGDAAAVSEVFTVNEDQWYRVRVSLVGTVVTVEVDGVMVKSHRTAVDMRASDRLALHCFAGPVHFRNIRAWRLGGPA